MPNTKLEQLDKVLARGTQDLVTHAEFLAVFKQLIKAIEQLKGDFLRQNYGSVMAELDRAKRTIEQANIKLSTDVEKRVIDLSGEMIKRINSLETSMPMHDHLVESVLESLPESEPLTGDMLIDEINDENTQGIIKKERVEGLEELEKKIKAVGTGTVQYVGGGGVTRGNVREYDLSGSLDGSTRTFALPAFLRVISVHLSSFPNILRPTTDYTVNYSTFEITFTSQIPDDSLSSGQTCIIIYSEN